MLIFILIKFLLAILLTMMSLLLLVDTISIPYWVNERRTPTTHPTHHISSLSFYALATTQHRKLQQRWLERKDKCKTDNNVIIFIHNTILHNEYYSLSLSTRTWLRTTKHLSQWDGFPIDSQYMLWIVYWNFCSGPYFTIQKAFKIKFEIDWKMKF